MLRKHCNSNKHGDPDRSNEQIRHRFCCHASNNPFRESGHIVQSWMRRGWPCCLTMETLIDCQLLRFCHLQWCTRKCCIIVYSASSAHTSQISAFSSILHTFFIKCPFSCITEVSLKPKLHLFMGANTATRAFGLTTAEPFLKCIMPTSAIHLLPHPSLPLLSSSCQHTSPSPFLN